MLTQAKLSDQAAMVALFDAGFADYSKGLNRTDTTRTSWVRRALDAGEAYWVGPRDGAAILEHKGTTLGIDALVIDPSKQRGGLGRKALGAIEDFARAQGATEVSLHTAQIFTHLVAFYSAADYRVISVGPHPKGRDDRLRVFFIKSLV